MAISRLIFPLYAQMLEALLNQLHRAQAYFGCDHAYEAMGERRLIDDMLPLQAQIRIVCMQAFDVTARLACTENIDVPPLHSLAEAEKAVAAALVAIETMRDADLDAAAPEMVRLELEGNLVFQLSGEEYVRDWAIPQFLFHIVTAYAIMRAAGVPLGKIDYIGHMFRHRKVRLNDEQLDVALPSLASNQSEGAFEHARLSLSAAMPSASDPGTQQ